MVILTRFSVQFPRHAVMGRETTELVFES
jgi:hypothetical protein